MIAQADSETRVAVVGGGLGGLAAACTLAARGYRVALFERNATIGGKAVQLRRDGYRFDMGPTILTLPSVLRRIFAEAGHDLDDRMELLRLDPQWRCFFEDGRCSTCRERRSEMSGRALRSFSGRASASAPGYRRSSWKLSERSCSTISDKFFFWKSRRRHRRTRWTSPDSFNARRRCATCSDLRMGRTVAGTVRSLRARPAWSLR